MADLGESSTGICLHVSPVLTEGYVNPALHDLGVAVLATLPVCTEGAMMPYCSCHICQVQLTMFYAAVQIHIALRMPAGRGFMRSLILLQVLAWFIILSKDDVLLD